MRCIISSRTEEFQSTPPARGATASRRRGASSADISIHAPREGGDRCYLPTDHAPPGFQSTPPARGATKRGRQGSGVQLFQSTPPARGATGQIKSAVGGELFQSTPPARGATRMHWAMRRLTRDFNPRPPRGGRLRDTSGCFASSSRFQSTPPARGATHGRSGHRFCSAISIHAPREGGDGDLPQQRIHMTISIHAPREGGDTGAELLHRIQDVISIHAPREGGDIIHTSCNFLDPVFQSTPPARGATSPVAAWISAW